MFVALYKAVEGENGVAFHDKKKRQLSATPEALQTQQEFCLIALTVEMFTTLMREAERNLLTATWIEPASAELGKYEARRLLMNFESERKELSAE
jgi:hypothetical protein